VGLERALELLAMPKKGRGGRTALKDLGTPEGADEAIQLFDGPYGLYVKQGKVNASLPEGTTADTITLEQAVELLAAKAAAGKTKGSKCRLGNPRLPASKAGQQSRRGQEAGCQEGPHHHQDRPPAGQCRAGDQGGRQLMAAPRPIRACLALVLALPLVACSGIPFGEQLSDSFSDPPAREESQAEDPQAAGTQAAGHRRPRKPRLRIPRARNPRPVERPLPTVLHPPHPRPPRRLQRFRRGRRPWLRRPTA
jgi:hypothetical protein